MKTWIDQCPNQLYSALVFQGAAAWRKRLMQDIGSITAARALIETDKDAEDIVQESFLRAYKQLGRFEARANFGTWIYRITANCCVDLMRSRQSRRDPSRARGAEHILCHVRRGISGAERQLRRPS